LKIIKNPTIFPNTGKTVENPGKLDSKIIKFISRVYLLFWKVRRKLLFICLIDYKL